MSSISSGTTLTTALVQTADTSGVLQLQTNGSTTALTLDTSQNATFAGKVASASSLQLATNGTTTAVTIDTNQNVGVGVTPSAWGSSYKAVQMSNATMMNTSAGGYYGANFYYNSSGSPTYVNNGYALAYSAYSAGGAHLWLTAPSGTAGNAISFAQAMTLDSSGNLLVGTTSAGGYKFNVVATSSYGALLSCSSGNLPLVCAINSGSGSQSYVYFYNGATLTGNITTTGTNTLYNSVSDYRLKENVAPMTGALATVAQLKPVTYNWKSTGSAGQGFVAHELQAVFPDCVSGEKDAVDADGKPKYQGIDTSYLVATLTAAIQELSAQVTTLQTQVTALKG